MVNYRLKDVGECDVEIEWLGKKPKMTMENLYSLYNGMDFESSSRTTKQCKQFFEDFKKALKNDLGTNYNVEMNLGHFYVSGFVSKNDEYVYFSVEDLRDYGNGFDRVLYRTAKNNKDYTGGFNRFCNFYDLANKIKSILEK